MSTDFKVTYDAALDTITPDRFEELTSEELELLIENMERQVNRISNSRDLQVINNANEEMQRIRKRINRMGNVIEVARGTFHFQHRLDRLVGRRAVLSSLLLRSLLTSMNSRSVKMTATIEGRVYPLKALTLENIRALNEWIDATLEMGPIASDHLADQLLNVYIAF